MIISVIDLYNVSNDKCGTISLTEALTAYPVYTNHIHNAAIMLPDATLNSDLLLIFTSFPKASSEM